MRAWWLVLGALPVLGACSGKAFSGGDEQEAGGSGGQGGSSGGKSGSGGKSSGGKSGSSASGGASNGGSSDGGNGTAGGSGGRAGDGGSNNPEGGAANAGNGGGGSGGDGNGGSGGDLSCPDEAPTTGTNCAGSLHCSFGEHPRASCRTQAICEAGLWVVTSPAIACPEVANCFEDLGMVPMVNGACDTTGTECFLDESVYCRCVPCVGQCNGDSVWDCRGPNTTTCPDRLPNLGTTCNGDDATCTYYGTCAYGESTSASCSAGAWAWTPLACAQ